MVIKERVFIVLVLSVNVVQKHLVQNDQFIKQ
jgi:hypothetical protein